MTVGLFVTACNDKPPKKEIIVVPAQVPVIIVKDPPEKARTTVTFDNNGVRIDTKKTEVIIKN